MTFDSFSLGGILTINIVVAAIMLLYTSYLDIKKREVEDKVWLVFGAVGAVLQAYEVLIGDTQIVALGLAIVLGTVIGMGLYFFGFYGGADGKALIVLAILVPQFTPKVGIYSIAPLIILTNGVLISILLPIGILLLNASRVLRKMSIFEGFSEPFHRKLLASFLGYKQTGKPRDFQFVMEKTVQQQQSSVGSSCAGGEEVKKFDFSMMRDDFETRAGTWVTPGIPLLVFFTAGFFAMLSYGDLVIGLIQFFAGFAGV